MAGQISLDVARKQGACIPCQHQDPPAFRPIVTRESAFEQRTIRVPASKLGLGHLAFIDASLFSGSKGSDYIFSVCDGLQVIETYAVPDPAEVVKFSGQRASASLPDKSMSQTVFTPITGAPISIYGIDITSPKQAWSEMRRILRDAAVDGMVGDIFKQGGAFTADRIGAPPVPLLIVTAAQSDSRVLDLAFAMGMFTDSPGKGARDTYWLQGGSRRIPIDSETTIMAATEFLSKNREPAVLYCADGGSDFATTTLGISGDTPALIVSAAPSSSPSFLATVGDRAPYQLAPLTTHDGPGWITNPRATRRIRAYWKRGKGAAKIRWFTKGAMRRCIRHLRKYFPENAGGLCANMHKEVTGEWPRGGVIPS